jgi:RNA recognition motif-containing protein
MNIFIGNLPYKIEESELRELFEDYGELTSLKIITDRQTGQSKGFGFAEMPDRESALKAIEDLNAAEIYGRNIVVKEAEERPAGDRKPGGFNRGGGGYKGGSGGYRKE